MDSAAVPPIPPVDIPGHVEPKAPTVTRWQRFVTTVWDADFYIKSPEERLLVHKLDCMILTVICESSSITCNGTLLTDRLWLVDEVPRSGQSRQCICERYEGGLEDPWQW